MILATTVRYYPSELNPGDPPATTCVLVAGDIGDYAAYTGHGSPDWVARWGQKISFQEASVQFFKLEREKYRGEW